MKYQPHIDGLRTVAVVPVVIFHLGSSILPGGYIGVDIFFVISGFLITTILLNDLSLKQYSLLDFYKRRILRILPALSIILFATFILSHFLLFEVDREDASKSIIAAAAFVSNFYFWNDAGYFTTPAESKPLLHTWSLAVEEQFYIFFPPLLFLLWKYARKYLMSVVVALSIISLFGCILLTIKNQPTAFYLLPPRAWELGAGAALAIWTTNKSLPKLSNTFVGVAGMALVLLPMVLLDSASVFPGWNAIAPVTGAVLVIGWGNSGLVGSILSSKPFTFIGKISYSFYLWHWPVIVFWKAYSGEHLSTIEMIGLGLASLAFGTISTYIIERPFRSQKVRQLRASRVVWAGAVGTVALVSIGGVGMAGYVTMRTFPENVTQIISTSNYPGSPIELAQFRTRRCFITSADRNFKSSFDFESCASPELNSFNVLLIGDSHAAQYWGPLAKGLPEANVMQATASGCRALLAAAGEKRCTDMRDWVYEEFLPHNHVDLIILGGRWLEEDIPLITPSLAKLKRLAGDVVVIGPTVEYEGNFPTLLAKSVLTGEDFDFATLLTPGRDRINELMRAKVEAANLGYVDVLNTQCSEGSCILFSPEGTPMQFDYGHLTFSGARFIIDAHVETFSSKQPYANETDFQEYRSN